MAFSTLRGGREGGEACLLQVFGGPTRSQGMARTAATDQVCHFVATKTLLAAAAAAACRSTLNDTLSKAEVTEKASRFR